MKEKCASEINIIRHVNDLGEIVKVVNLGRIKVWHKEYIN